MIIYSCDACVGQMNVIALLSTEDSSCDSWVVKMNDTIIAIIGLCHVSGQKGQNESYHFYKVMYGWSKGPN